MKVFIFSKGNVVLYIKKLAYMSYNTFNLEAVSTLN